MTKKSSQKGKRDDEKWNQEAVKGYSLLILNLDHDWFMIIRQQFS